MTKDEERAVLERAAQCNATVSPQGYGYSGLAADAWCNAMHLFAAAIRSLPLTSKDSDAEPVADCGNCHKCLEGKFDDRFLPIKMPIAGTRMILCPVCGNKRCPKASNHELVCTGSNDTGQEGSVYKLHPPQPCTKCAEWLKENGPGGWIDDLRNRAEAAEARADKWQSAYAKEFDIRNGTPCEQIRWQEVLDDTRENLAQTQMELDDLRQTVKRLYRKLTDKESDFAKAVHAQIQGWGHNAMRRS